MGDTNNKVKVFYIQGKTKCFYSPEVNYSFDLEDGTMIVIGKDKDTDAKYSPYGPFLADIEISTICNGVCGKDGISCSSYCYKENKSIGENMSYETFAKIITKINPYETLTQVAFGLGATGEENPDLWRMCLYLRSKNIIPNGTIANISDDTADRIAGLFGACAVSYHGDFDIFANSVKKLTDRGMDQVNCHLVIYEENYEEVLQFFDKVETDPRVEKLNAIVLLSVKKKGAARKNNKINPMSQQKFNKLIEVAMAKELNFGFDSCSYHKFIEAVKDHPRRKEFETYAEPCESFGTFSFYCNVKGEYSFCSFCEGENKVPTFNILNTEGNFIDTVWNGDIVKRWRERSLSCGRECLIFKI
jgi:hypothetical protein